MFLKDYTYKVSANRSARTLTIREYYKGKLSIKFRTCPLTKDEFNYYVNYATQNDILMYLRNNSDYSTIKSYTK